MSSQMTRFTGYVGTSEEGGTPAYNFYGNDGLTSLLTLSPQAPDQFWKVNHTQFYQLMIPSKRNK